MGCQKKTKPYCLESQDGTKCEKNRASGKTECGKPGQPTKKKPDCADVATDLDMSDQAVCKKALFLCGDLPAVVSSCKTKCFENGKFKAKDKACVRCRGKDSLRAPGGEPGKPGDKPEKRPFDPARVKDTIKQIADKLDEKGKKCVKRVAEATSKLRTQIRRWRDNTPDKEPESEEENEVKELSDVQAEIDETAEGSKDLENEFEDDTEGKAARAKNLWERLEQKMSDMNKPKNCGAEFDALKAGFNAIVQEYKDLPSALKAKGVERVKMEFSDTDFGQVDLKDSKSVCKFAGRLVSQLKKAEKHHKTRLQAARKLLCTKAGDLLKNKLVSNLYNCLRKAKRDARAANTTVAKQEADDDAKKFDRNTLQRIKKLMGMMKKKCLVKDNAKSDPARVVGAFKGKLKAKIKKKVGSMTDAEKKAIADKFNAAVEKQNPDASNIVTTITHDTSRRQLRDRRGLAASADVETTWDNNAPSNVGDDVNVDLGGDFDAAVPTMSSQPTSGSIQGTQPVAPIDDTLPNVPDDSTTTAMATTVPGDAGDKADSGAGEVM